MRKWDKNHQNESLSLPLLPQLESVPAGSKSSQDSAVVVEQLQPQQLSAEVLPQALLEQIIHQVSDEVTRRLSSTSGKRSANDSQILDRGSDMLVGGVGAGAEQVSEVPALGIPADSPGESMIEGAVSQFLG